MSRAHLQIIRSRLFHYFLFSLNFSSITHFFIKAILFGPVGVEIVIFTKDDAICLISKFFLGQNSRFLKLQEFEKKNIILIIGESEVNW